MKPIELLKVTAIALMTSGFIVGCQQSSTDDMPAEPTVVEDTCEGATPEVRNAIYAAKLKNVRIEMDTLIAARDAAIAPSPELTGHTADLKKINESLWDIEDDIRDCERQGDLGEKFIELARSVYRSNDRRAALKREINELLGSHLIEEKSYADYE